MFRSYDGEPSGQKFRPKPNHIETLEDVTVLQSIWDE